MNYLRISRDLGCENISDVRITIGNRYVLSTDTNKDVQNTESLLADLLFNMKRINEKIVLEDHYTGEVLTDKLESLGVYISQQHISQLNEKTQPLNIDFIPLTFKEQLWKHLVNKYEYLRADIEGNFDKFKEFISWLMELMCEQYEQSFLKNSDDEDRYMQFDHYVDHTVNALDSIIRQKASLTDDYFQKRYYLLKEEFVAQETELASLLKMPHNTNFNDIYDRIEHQQSAMSTSISNIIKDIDLIKGSSEIFNIKQGLETAKNTLSAILNDISINKGDAKKREKREIIDGYFLPFHRIKTKQNMKDSGSSKRSLSLQNSRNVYSEKVSYESHSRQLLSSRLNLGSGIRDNRNTNRIKKNYSDNSIKKRGILEDPNDNVYSIHELNAVELKELAKYKEILVEFGFSEEELNDPELTNARITDYLKLQSRCDALNTHCNDLNEQIKQIDQHNNHLSGSDVATYEGIIRTLENRLNENEDQLKLLFEDYMAEKNGGEQLRHICNELRQKNHILEDNIDRKETLNKLLTSKTEGLLFTLQKAVAPRINIYKAELEELTTLINDGYIQNLMATYKELKDKKLEMSDERIEFLKNKCEQFVNELEQTAKNSKALAQYPDFTSKNIKLANILATRFESRYNKVFEKLKSKLQSINHKLVINLSEAKMRLQKLITENLWLTDEVDLIKRENDGLTSDYSANVENIQAQYKQIVEQLNNELEEKTEQINDLQDQLDIAKNKENYATQDLQRGLADYNANMEAKDRDLTSLQMTIHDLRDTINKQVANKVSNDIKNEFVSIDDELEKLNIMNSKLVGEIEILTKRNNHHKTEIETLAQKLFNQEDLQEKFKELTLSNKILENKIELLESYKLIEESGANKQNSVGSNGDGLPLVFEQDNEYVDGSRKDSNETIHEVEEGLERSDIDHSLDMTKLKNNANGQSLNKVPGFSIDKPKDTKKSDYLLTTIDTNYVFTHNKDDMEKGFASPRSSSVKKHIFSADSIIKNIEALRRSTQDIKNDDTKNNKIDVHEFSTQDANRKLKVKKVIDLINNFNDSVSNVMPMEKLSSLEEKVRRLQLILTENDIENLAQPKRDSNLRALTEHSKSSKNNSYSVDNDNFERDRSNSRKASTTYKKNKINRKVEKLIDDKDRQIAKQLYKKRSSKLDNVAKQYTTLSPSKKVPSKQNKDLNSKQSKFLTQSGKPQKKESKRSGIDFDIGERGNAIEWQKIEDELEAQIDDLHIEKNNLINEIEFMKDKNQKDEETLRRAFDLAFPLIEEQLEDSINLNPYHLDQIIEIIKTKLSRYEEALDTLQQEVENLKEEYREHDEQFQIEREPTSVNKSEETSLIEIDLHENQPENAETENGPLNDMKKAFDELICEMFTVTADNIDNITNLENFINEDIDTQGTLFEGITKDDVNGELAKIKGDTLRLKEMIEVLYENLMTYMNDNQANRAQSVIQIDDTALASLQTENEYLCKRLEIFNENYQDLNKKYLHLLNEKNLTLGKSTSTPELEYHPEQPCDESLKEKMRKFIQNNINFVQNVQEQHDIEEASPEQEQEQEYDLNTNDQVYQLTYLLRHINQIIKSENTDEYKILKIEDILDNPEEQ